MDRLARMYFEMRNKESTWSSLSSFNNSFERATEWLQNFICSCMMQYMAVGYSLFYLDNI